MPRCIYREVDLNFSKPESGDTATAEHIIPWAIGGSNGFVTPDASKTANNDLGSEVDARFTDTLPLAIKRHQLQLKSQNGNITPIVWRGASPDGTGVTVSIHVDGRVELDFDIVVARPEKEQTGAISVVGSREQLEPILARMPKGMKRRNEIAYSEDGNLLQPLDDFWSASEQTLVDRARLNVKYFNQAAWTRGMLKIALAAGHRILGPDWTFGPGASVIRAIVKPPRKMDHSSARLYRWSIGLIIALGPREDGRRT